MPSPKAFAISPILLHEHLGLRYRVADFLKSHAPFDSVPEAELLALAAKGRVKFHEADEYVHRLGQAKTPFIWIIQQGRIELVLDHADERRLIDVVGEGDILGLDRFVGDGKYRCSACTTTDVILYAIDAAGFEDLLTRQPDVERYLDAHFSVTATAAGRPSWLDAEPPTAEFLKVRQAAATPELPELPEHLTTRDAIRILMDNNVTAARADDAVLTAADLALFCNYNPARLLNEIRNGRSANEITPLLKLAGRLVMDALARSSDVDDCARMATQFVAAATAACIRLAEQDAVDAGIPPPQARYAWFAYGTLARGELLRLVPPKVGMVFDDNPLGDPTSAGIYGAVVSGRVSDWLHKCGLSGPEAQWPEGSHPCMQLTEWKYFFGSTIRNPIGHDLFARREFFDIRPLSGDESLIGEIREWLAAQLQLSELLVPLLANDTLGNLPPLTFFSGLVVAFDGTESRDLDLVGTALHPISDAARVFALAAGSPAVNTLERLASAAAGSPLDAQIFHDAAEAYRVALYQQALAGASRIDPSKLARLDQRLLKTAFGSILRLLELTTRRFITCP